MSLKNLFFHAVILSVIVGTAVLGVWQLQRREWKRELIQTMQSRTKMPATKMPQQINADWYWRTVQVSGTLDYDHKILIPYYGELEACGEPPPAWGKEIWVPLKRADGTTLFYRSGVASEDDPFMPHAVGQRDVKNLQGIIRPFPAASIFTPANHPEKQFWLRGDSSLYRSVNAPPLDYFLENDGAIDVPESDGCVSPNALWRGVPQLPNNHLAYAITWFSLAAVLMVLYIYRLWELRNR